MLCFKEEKKNQIKTKIKIPVASYKCTLHRNSFIYLFFTT